MSDGVQEANDLNARQVRHRLAAKLESPPATPDPPLESRSQIFPTLQRTSWVKTLAQTSPEKSTNLSEKMYRCCGTAQVDPSCSQR